MDTSGERFVPEAGMGIEIELEHIHRYEAIAPFLKGKVVIDAACGAGYGTNIIAKYAKKVIGIDIDADAIKYAKSKFANDNVEFREMSVTNIDMDEASIDAVVSFETIEHISEECQHEFLNCIVRVLSKDGILIMSTPDLNSFLTKSNGRYYNPYHIKEYNYNDYKKLLLNYFKEVKIYYQERIMCSVIEGENSKALNSLEKFSLGDYMIAVCSNTPIDYELASIYLPHNDKKEIHTFLYLDYGSGYSEKNKISLASTVDYNGDFNIQCDIDTNNVKKLRLDPVDFPAQINLSVSDDLGNKLDFKPINYTYLLEDNNQVFMHNDPYYEYVVSGEISHLKISGTFKRIDAGELFNYWYSRLNENEQEKRKLIEQNEKAYNKLLNENSELVRENKELKIENSGARSKVQTIEDEYNSVINSICWKITAPVRVAGNISVMLINRLKRFIAQKRGYINNSITNNYDGSLCYRGEIHDVNIPKEWISLWKQNKTVSLIIAIKNVEEYEQDILSTLDSICSQSYEATEVIIVGSEHDNTIFKTRNTILNMKFISCDASDITACWKEGIANSCGDYIGIVEQGDILDQNAIAYTMEVANEYPEVKLITVRDDVLWENEDKGYLCDKKNALSFLVGAGNGAIHFSIYPKTFAEKAIFETESWIQQLDDESIKSIPAILYHVAPKKDIWKKPGDVRCIAFYLPQFHEIPENNKWWGDGFTEWSNVKKASPLYTGHYQPRIPGKDIGYYSLGDNYGKATQLKQIEMAKQYGIYGFCYYYYWFDDGKRLLEKPLDRHLNDEEFDFPFCLCWANENWTKSWDGLTSEVLMPQTYSEGWEKIFVEDLIPYISDRRYIKVNGAPYILIYNLQDIKNPAHSINTIRKLAKDYGIDKLHISAVRRSLNSEEFQISGYSIDSLTDFPPHLIGAVGIDHDEAEKYGLNEGQVKDYRKAARYHENMEKQPFTYFRTAILQWDNTARRGKDAYVFEDFSFEEYKKWLYAIKRYTLRQNRPGEDLLFINAWNEWAEGTYLEPDEKNGYAALEATKEVMEMR